MIDYLLRIGSCLSQLLNTVVFNGHPNESVSGRAARISVIEKQSHWFWNNAYFFINRLFFFQENHCLDAHLNERVWCRAIMNEKEV